MKQLLHFSYLLYLLILIFSSAAAGRQKTDSLHAELFKTDNVKDKLRLYLSISKEFEDVDADSAIFFLNQARNIANQLNIESMLADVHAQSALFAVKRNQLDQAHYDFDLAAYYYEKCGEIDQSIRMKAFLGNIYLARDNLSEAMKYYIEVIDHLAKKNNPQLLPLILNNVGNIYIETEDYNAALDYYTKAIGLFKKSGDTVNMVFPLMNLGVIYYEIGNMEFSEDYTQQAINQAVKINDKIMESRGWMMMGQIRGKRKDYTGAMEMLNRSFDIQKKITTGYLGPKNIVYSELLVQMGKTYLEDGNYIKALKFSREGYWIAGEMKQIKQSMLAAKQLSLIYKHKSQCDSALHYFMIYMNLSDSLTKSRNLRAVKIMEIKQEFEKRQKENEQAIASAKSEKRLILIMYVTSGAFLLAFILLLVLMLKLERQRKRQVELEKRNLNEKLEFQNKELTTNVIYLSKLNELVFDISQKLESLDMESDSQNAKLIKSIISELKQTYNAETWNEFEVRFLNVHVDFYKKLSDKYPNLSANDLKMCAFLRLNLNTKEICAVTYQTQDSVRAARSRLRQKLNLSKDETLVSFLSQF